MINQQRINGYAHMAINDGLDYHMYVEWLRSLVVGGIAEHIQVTELQYSELLASHYINA